MKAEGEVVENQQGCYAVVQRALHGPLPFRGMVPDQVLRGICNGCTLRTTTSKLSLSPILLFEMQTVHSCLLVACNVVDVLV